MVSVDIKTKDKYLPRYKSYSEWLGSLYFFNKYIFYASSYACMCVISLRGWQLAMTEL